MVAAPPGYRATMSNQESNRKSRLWAPTLVVVGVLLVLGVLLLTGVLAG